MIKLNDDELKNINGGVNYALLAIIGSIVAFGLAFFDGFIRPLPCRK